MAPMRAVLASSVRAPEETRSVAPLELFFDLVYVFAITQLSHHLVAHFDVRTAGETLVLTLAVVYAWYMTAWLSNWLSPTQRPVQALLLTIMLLSLLMSSSISGAFEDRAWLFAGTYVAIQIVRAGFATVVFAPGTPQRIHFVNDLGWEVVTGAMWLAGAAADGDARLVIWAVAVTVTYLGVMSGHPVPGRSSHLVTPIGSSTVQVHSDVSGEHILERGRLFFLIALGETLLTTGTAFAAGPIEVGPLVAFVNAFVCAAAIWWCYFHRAEGEGLRATEESEDASGVAALATWILTLMVLAIVGIAVTDELAIAHPGHASEPLFVVLAFGGPAIFLLSQLLFMFRVGGAGLAPRVFAVAVFAVLTVLALLAEPSMLAVSIAATVVVVAVAWSDTRFVNSRATA